MKKDLEPWLVWLCENGHSFGTCRNPLLTQGLHGLACDALADTTNIVWDQCIRALEAVDDWRYRMASDAARVVLNSDPHSVAHPKKRPGIATRRLLMTVVTATNFQEIVANGVSYLKWATIWKEHRISYVLRGAGAQSVCLPLVRHFALCLQCTGDTQYNYTVQQIKRKLGTLLKTLLSFSYPFALLHFI